MVANIKINEFVSISPAYLTEVNIQADFDDISKVEGYLPNHASQRALSEILVGIMPTSSKRVHLLTGQYGTGKSHFGLVLAALVRKLPTAQEVLNKIREKDEAVAKRVQRLLNGVQKYLVIVPDVHDYSQGFDRMLLTSLEDALHREQIEFRPQSHFREAERVINEWKRLSSTTAEDNPYQKLRAVLLAEQGWEIDMLIGQLRKYSEKAYAIFESAHRKVAYGASFQPNVKADPKEIYKQTIEHLKGTGEWEGIWLICDEFGQYLTRLAQDPHSDESLNIQQFAEYCKRSAEKQCHFTVIAHQSLADYAAGFRSEKDWEKISGRFIPDHSLENIGSGHEEIEIIETIILRNRETKKEIAWQEIMRHETVSMLSDATQNAGLFDIKDSSWFINKLLLGCFPLHPFTSYCLPWLARNLGQRERTLFTFFNDSSQTGLRQFIHDELLYQDNGQLNLYTVDRLIDYFEPSATAKIRDPRYKRIVAARHEALRQVGNSPFSQRIINTLTIFELVGSQNLPPTEGNLIIALHLDQSSTEEAKNLLTELSEEKKIVRRRTNGYYELRYRSEFDLQEAIREEKRRLRPTFDSVDALDSLPGFDEKTGPLLGESYKKKHFISREAVREIISPSSLANPNHFIQRIKGWYQPDRGKYEGDLLILYVLTEDTENIRTATNYATNEACKHPQLIIAVPKNPWPITEKLLQLQAMREIKNNSSSFPNMTDADKEELSQDIGDLQGDIDKELIEFLRADNFTWHCNGQITTNLSRGSEIDFISGLLTNIFNKTPQVEDDYIANILRGRDAQKRYRQEAITRLLEHQGHITIAMRGGSPEERIFRNCFKNTEVFELKADKGRYADFEVRDEWPKGSSLRDIWLLLHKHLRQQPDKVERFDKVISELLTPPYGLSHQLIEMVLAAFFRNHLDEYAFAEIKSHKQKTLDIIALDAQTISNIVSAPKNYALTFYEIHPSEKEYVNGMINTLIDNVDKTEEVGIWERGKEALQAWFTVLPTITIETGAFNNPHCHNLIKLFKDKAKTTDGKRLLKTYLPEALDVTLTSPPSDKELVEIIARFESCYEELTNYAESQARLTIKRLIECFGGSGATRDALRDSLQNWYANLSESQQLHVFSGNAGHLQNAINSEKDIDQRMLKELPIAMQLGDFKSWTESTTVDLYLEKVRVAKMEIENWQPSSPTVATKENGDTSAADETFSTEFISIKQQFRDVLSSVPIETAKQILRELLIELENG
ncbi:MAG: hypothetical protein CL608_26230 [Anaerolineaceae bacterium]|nr:hypothetical protein [Anaerolineaceae bacterium]